MTLIAETKQCAFCKLTKPVEQFWRRTDRPSGRQTRCKVCQSKRRKRWGRTRKGLAWIQKKNAVNLRTPYGRFQRLHAHAKIQGVKVTLTLPQYSGLLMLPCHYCKGPLPQTGGGLDRKRWWGNYSLKNVVPCCHSCNSTKQRKSVRWMLERVKSK